MGYIDAHVHVWTDDLDSYPLADGFSRDQMKPPIFLPEDILGHAEPCGVDRIVLIQMSYYRFDNSYMLDVIEEQPEIFKGIAVIDSQGGNTRDVMCDLKQKGVKGFRIYPGDASPESWLETDGYEEMFRCGADENLAMCPLINPDALPAVGRMCDKFPDTPVIIDHLSLIGDKGIIEQNEIDSLTSLARHSNIKVKVSAFYALGEKKTPHDDLGDLIRQVFMAYGPDRLMWASDCPFQVDDESYDDSVALIRDRLDYLSAEDREWILTKTAEQSFYTT